jgi:hypothetical protein
MARWPLLSAKRDCVEREPMISRIPQRTRRDCAICSVAMVTGHNAMFCAPIVREMGGHTSTRVQSRSIRLICLLQAFLARVVTSREGPAIPSAQNKQQLSSG